MKFDRTRRWYPMGLASPSVEPNETVEISAVCATSGEPRKLVFEVGTMRRFALKEFRVAGVDQLELVAAVPLRSFKRSAVSEGGCILDLSNYPVKRRDHCTKDKEISVVLQNTSDEAYAPRGALIILAVVGF